MKKMLLNTKNYLNKMKKQIKIYVNKLLRYLHITKPIFLSKQEQQWILLIKGHYKKEYPYVGEWTETLKPMFDKVYGWTAGEFYNDYLNCIFGKLLSIHSKIATNYCKERELIEIFNASFSKSFSREQELPIERAISKLCGLIQCSLVFENGVNRFNLIKQ